MSQFQALYSAIVPFRNHYPGKIFNSPKGSDVYAGVKIDYRGDDVTPENFVAVLMGDQLATRGGNGRVLKRFFLSLAL